MKFRTTWILLVTVLCLLVAVYFADRTISIPPGERMKTLLEGVVHEDVHLIGVESGSFRIECVRRDQNWFLSYPVRGRADAGILDAVLADLNLPVSEVITAKQREERDLTLADYGFKEPRARFTVMDKTLRREILFGADAPVGDLIYVKFRDHDEIFAISRSITNLVPVSTDAWRDRFVIRANPVRIARLEIHRPEGFLQLVREGNAWFLKQPVAARADSARVTALLDGLTKIRAVDFVYDPSIAEVKTAADAILPVAGAGVETYGTAPDMAAARISLWLEGDEIGTELIVGKPVPGKEALLFARHKDGESIFSIPRSALQLTSTPVNDLRDRLVFPIKPDSVRYFSCEAGDARIALRRDDISGWSLEQPTRAKADEEAAARLVSVLTRLEFVAFLPDLQTNNLAELGLQPPSFILQLSSNPPSTQTVAAVAAVAVAGSVPDTRNYERVMVGPSVDGKRKVKYENGASIQEIDDAVFQALGPNLVNPLAYRDRTVLAIPLDSIRRITLIKNNTEQVVGTETNSIWRVLPPTEGLVDADVLTDALFLIANLRADRIESFDPNNLAAYGLGTASSSLVFGLSGEKGIQKTLLLGYKAGTDGVYAMVQGQDLLFVLRKYVADLLIRDLVRKAQPKEPDPVKEPDPKNVVQ